MPKLIFVVIFLMIAGCSGTASAGNIDFLWSGSNVRGIKNSTLGIDFADTIEDKLELSAYYRKGKTDGIVTQDEGELDLNYSPAINERWSLWLDERVGYNKVLGIDFENDIGAGLKYYIYKKKSTKLSFSGGFLYQFTSLNCSDPATCEQTGQGRYSYRAKFNNDFLSLIYFYQPSMQNSADYITKFTGDLKLAKIKDHISLLFNYKNEYRSLYGRSESGGIKLRIEY
jgi:hypothetical protein